MMSTDNTKKFLGRGITRNEDARLLTGRALFVGDVDIPGMLHAVFLRSAFAHASIRNIDVTAAKEVDGVVAVYTAEDLGDLWKPGPLLVPAPHSVENVVFNQRTQVPMAKDKVRYVGEPLAVVIATDRYIAEDAAELIWVDYDPLEPVVDMEKALEEGSPLIHEEIGTNLCAHLVQHKGDYAKARKQADLVISRRFDIDRGAAAAMENRGLVAHWDERSQHLTVWDTTQAPIPVRNGLAAMFNLSQHQVRVIAPFVGGGFGPKIMMFLANEVVIPWASMKLGKPIKWIEDRQENFIATTQERGQVHDVEMALDSEGRILGIKDVFIHDTGAYDPYGMTVPLNTQSHAMSSYDIANIHSEVRVAYTNKMIVTPVRGAGRPQGIFVAERMLDIAARELDIDRTEIRKKNFIPPDKFPYNHEIIDQAFSSLIFDSGNYEATFEQALERIGYQDFIENQQPELREQGRHVGIGVVSFIETTGVGPYEGARITVGTSGEILVVTGVGTQGQGHFTSFAQIVADELGVDVRNVTMVTGDTAEFHWGTGTFASRGSVVAANAIYAAAKAVRSKILKLASKVLETPEEELELEDGSVHVADIPQQSISLGELAILANPLRGAVEPGTEPGLEATDYFGPQYGATANGSHAMILEIDPETMEIDILKYVAVEDCGTQLNPLIVEGQVHGGIALGIGNSYYEKLVYSPEGQLLNASLADYLIPTAMEVPRIETGHEETKSPLNPLGSKGAGEAGTIPVPALFAQAVEDALYPNQVEILEAPLSPNRLFEILSQVQDNVEVNE